MKCKSCKEDVPPKFVHAISVNICPLCGQEIMDTKLQSILNDLKHTMDSAKEYSEQVEDWLHSNYSLKKVNSDEIVVPTASIKQASVPTLTPSHSKPITIRRSEDDQDQDEVFVNDQQIPTSIFAERAGVSKLKKAVDRIKGNIGAADPSEFEGVDEEYGDSSMADEGNTMPLDSRGKRDIQNIFQEEDIYKAQQEFELQRIKKLRAQSAVGGNGGGAFRRE
jgi:hypothetical protein